MLTKIFEKLRSIRTNYLNRSPKEKWCFVRDAGIMVLTLTGVPVLDPNFEVYLFSYASGLVIFEVTISFIYTVWYYKDTDPIKGMLNIPLYFGVLVPSGISYACVMIDSKRAMYQSLMFFGGNKIYTNVNRHSDMNYIRVCDASAIKLLKTTVVTLGIVIVSMNVYLGFPMYSYTFKHELQLPIPVLLPFTDDETSRGLLINFGNQVFVALVGLAGNIGVEIITCILKNNLVAATASIGYSVHRFTEMIKNAEQHFTLRMDYEFRQILVQVQDLDRYILELSNFYYWRFFLKPILGNFSVAIALFFYLFVDWTAGLGAAFLTYSQMLILCDIGNEVDKTSDDLLYTFNTMPWYLLSQKNQLTYGHLLNRLQHGAKLKVGPIALLNYETFTNMSKRIYSVLAMLNNTIA